MSKNYKIGSKFRVTSNSTNGFNVGEIVNLVARRVDGLFEMDNGVFQQALYADQLELVCEPLSQKLKPAKQALADAINQNCGLAEGGDWHKNGELPPVGEVCLYVVSDRRSAEVEITAHAKFGLCFVEIGKSGECYASKTAELHRFRPIRTEREKAIDEMVSLVEPLATYREFAGAIYDAGMYKEVK